MIWQRRGSAAPGAGCSTLSAGCRDGRPARGHERPRRRPRLADPRPRGRPRGRRPGSRWPGADCVARALPRGRPRESTAGASGRGQRRARPRRLRRRQRRGRLLTAEEEWLAARAVRARAASRRQQQRRAGGSSGPVRARAASRRQQRPQQEAPGSTLGVRTGAESRAASAALWRGFPSRARRLPVCSLSCQRAQTSSPCYRRLPWPRAGRTAYGVRDARRTTRMTWQGCSCA